MLWWENTIVNMFRDFTKYIFKFSLQIRVNDSLGIFTEMRCGIVRFRVDPKTASEWATIIDESLYFLGLKLQPPLLGAKVHMWFYAQ
jgi:hypothetical protein